MRIHQLNRTQWIPRSLEQVFPFFEKLENLALITPHWLGFEILSPSPITMAAGCLIDYRIRISGWPMLWRTHIAVYEPSLRFADEQLQGTYVYWYHLHGFEVEGGGTRLTDRVRYALPHWLPAVAERQLHDNFIAPALENIFNYRASIFNRLFGADQHQLNQGGDQS